MTYNNVENPKPNRTLRYSVDDCLHIYYLLIIAILDSALIQQIFQNITKYIFFKCSKKYLNQYNIYIL